MPGGEYGQASPHRGSLAILPALATEAIVPRPKSSRGEMAPAAPDAPEPPAGGQLARPGWRRTAAAAALAASLAALAAGVLFVRAYGVDLPRTDDWDVVPLLGKAAAGRLTLADLFQQHNEHRIAVPRFLFVLLARLTRYDLVVVMYLNQLVLAACVALLAVHFRRRLSLRASWFLFAPLPLLVFTPRQWLSMLWAFGICLALVCAFSLAAFSLLGSAGRATTVGRRLLLLGGAALAAACGSLTMASGLLAWPIGLAQLALQPAPGARRRSNLVLWGTAGLVFWGLYFIGYQRPAQHPPPLWPWQSPLAFVKFFLFFLAGSLFGQRPREELLAGVLILAVALAALAATVRARRLGREGVGLSLLALGLASALSGALMRARMGLVAAVDQKYSLFAALVLIGSLLLLCDLPPEWRRRWMARAAVAALLLLTAAGLVMSWPAALRAGPADQRVRRAQVALVRSYAEQPDSALAQLHVPRVVRQGAAILDRLGWSVFAEGRP
jgi:hypothetical protein